LVDSDEYALESGLNITTSNSGRMRDKQGGDHNERDLVLIAMLDGTRYLDEIHGHQG
jgi:hypothetical protein